MIKICHGEQLRKFHESQHYEHLPIPNRKGNKEEIEQKPEYTEDKTIQTEKNVVISSDDFYSTSENELRDRSQSESSENEVQRKSNRLKDKTKPTYQETRPRKPKRKTKTATHTTVPKRN